MQGPHYVQRVYIMFYEPLMMRSQHLTTRLSNVQWTLESRTQSVPRGGSTFNLFDFRVKWHKQHDAVQCRAHGSTFEFFQLDPLFLNVIIYAPICFEQQVLIIRRAKLY
jgi:hypothetical protein